MIWTVVGILLGIIIGLGLAVRITVQNIKASNDVGDSRGELQDFQAVLNIISDEDNLTSFNRDRRNRIRLEDHYRRLTGTYAEDPPQ